jgi:NADPH:quinone reductase-like Zn-dependent oxidoreductase
MRIHALGLNRAEAMFRSGQYVQESKLPGRPGYEATGIIEAIGEGVEDRAAARQGAGGVTQSRREGHILGEDGTR